MNVVVLPDEQKPRMDILAGYGDLLGVPDLAEIFKVSKQTVYKEIKQGKFGKPVQIGRAFKIPKIYIVKRYFSGNPQ